jgi:hypothetical protein
MPNAIVVSYANSLSADIGMKLYPGHLAEVIHVKALEDNIRSDARLRQPRDTHGDRFVMLGAEQTQPRRSIAMQSGAPRVSRPLEKLTHRLIDPRLPAHMAVAYTRASSEVWGPRSLDQALGVGVG